MRVVGVDVSLSGPSASSIHHGTNSDTPNGSGFALDAVSVPSGDVNSVPITRSGDGTRTPPAKGALAFVVTSTLSVATERIG